MLGKEHKGVMLAWVRLLDPSRAAEFHRWYNTVHVVDVLETPGVTAGHRFVNARDDGDEDRKFFLVYEVGEEDVNAVSKRLPQTFANKQHRRLDCYKMTYGANFKRIL